MHDFHNIPLPPEPVHGIDVLQELEGSLPKTDGFCEEEFEALNLAIPVTG
jgi:hypothetical protein